MLYIFLAHGFEEVEALATLDILRRLKLDVLTVGVGSKTVVGSHSIPVVCDKTIDEVSPGADLQGVILPGGMPGTANLEKNETVLRFIRYSYENEKLVCAICAAPSILGHLGLLDGVEATCFPGYETDLIGAVISKKSVCSHGNIITAKGCGVSLEFGLAIGARLAGEQAASKVADSIQLHRI